MNKTCGLLAAASALALAACNTPDATTPIPSGGSAGAAGPGYCDTVPTDPEALSDWNELCSDMGRR